jgi:hypothetical protein
MSYQRRALILNLALFLLGMGATVGCHADGVAAPRAVSGSQSATLLLCTVDFSPCVSAVPSTQTTAHNAGRQGSIEVRPPQLASGGRGVNAGWQTSDRSVSGSDVNFSVASMGADTDANMGRLALNVTLDSYYHGAIYNSQAPFEPMQVSLDYVRAW